MSRFRRLGREVNWGVFFALLFTLLFWTLSIRTVAAQAVPVSASVFPTLHGDTIAVLEPGNGVRAMYDSVVTCAGPQAVASQTFESITFLLREAPVDLATGDITLGEWAADTIWLSQGYEGDGWVIAHELMHHVLKGPPSGNPHPKVPFMSCGLYTHPAELEAPEPEPAPLTGPNFAYPVLGYAVYSQGTILAGHGWTR